MNKAVLIGLAVVVVAGFLFKLSNGGNLYKPGELYSVDSENGFRIAKVLATDDQTVHIRLYKNFFGTRPAIIDESKLTLGTIDDPDGFGVGHLPLSRDQFRSWHPVFITKTAVRRDELEGYELWKKSNSGVWR